MTQGLPGQVPLHADDASAAALAHIGRTEDLRVRRDGRVAVIAGFITTDLTFFEVAVDDGVSLRAAVTVSDASLSGPHGVEFVTDDVIVVSDRTAGLRFFRLVTDPGALLPRALDLLPVDAGDMPALPVADSVTLVGPPSPEGGTLAVCLGEQHRVVLLSVHIDPQGVRVGAGPSLECPWLAVPDGVAASSDGEWIAVSSHWNHVVVMLRRTDDGYRPAGVLHGPAFPHGLRFLPDDRGLVVADAGAPYVFVFATDSGWDGSRYPVSRLRAVHQEDYLRIATVPGEGGPKGVDLIADGALMLVTSETQSLAVFPTDHSDATGTDPWTVDHSRLQKTTFMRDAKDRIAETWAEVDAHARALTTQLTDLQAAHADLQAQYAQAADALDETGRDRTRISQAYEDTTAAHRDLIARHDQLVEAHRAAQARLAAHDAAPARSGVLARVRRRLARRRP